MKLQVPTPIYRSYSGSILIIFKIVSIVSHNQNL